MVSTTVEIELWEDEAGASPVAEFIALLPVEHQEWIAKRNDFLERLTWPELHLSKYYEKIQGTAHSLWELKYSGSRAHVYRAICFRWKHQLVTLEIFAGSGSSGNVLRHVPVAAARAENWKVRNP
ncbi:MAG: hypothetical protein Athens041674_94 [Parcubacteria group bacterium Athens0416_74]|nr:MAG: hypothetical protein Athens041674_94 [Parcubacteria group bacterium Athens0416_74]